MQILMYSSKTEVTLKGVPSLFVKIKTCIWVWTLVSSDGTQSFTTEGVAEDVVNILGGASRSGNDISDFNLVGSARFLQVACSSKVTTHQDTNMIGILKNHSNCYLELKLFEPFNCTKAIKVVTHYM